MTQNAGLMLSREEINGDLRLSPLRRLVYLVRNATRNAVLSPVTLCATAFCEGRVMPDDGTPSAYRAMGQAFIRTQLGRLLPHREIKVLDVGCGGGHMSDLLAEAGFRGLYVGVDIDDRFVRDTGGPAGFQRRFVQADAHDFPETETYDLVFSNSALEHIPDDHKLVSKLGRLTAPGGVQIHIVPGGWALPLYLWHGYRQYPLARIVALFGEGTEVYCLGGLASFTLHFMVITVGEILLRLRLRDRFPAAYRALLNRAMAADRLLRVCPGMHIVCCQAPGRRVSDVDGSKSCAA